MKITCTRRLQFCAGHRVVGHEGKCADIHGHNYIVYLRAEAEKLDELGRVIDFSVLKERIGGWLERSWDHQLLIWDKDPCPPHRGNSPRRVFWPVTFNPTVENMAAYILEYSDDLLRGTGARLSRVEIWETENCMGAAER